MRIIDCSSDGCSSDLLHRRQEVYRRGIRGGCLRRSVLRPYTQARCWEPNAGDVDAGGHVTWALEGRIARPGPGNGQGGRAERKSVVLGKKEAVGVGQGWGRLGKNKSRHDRAKR